MKVLNNLDINDTQESDLIYFQDRLMILCESLLILSPLQGFQFSTMGGPSNINTTLAHLLVSVVCWPGMDIDVQNFALKCKFVGTTNTIPYHIQPSRTDPHPNSNM